MPNPHEASYCWEPPSPSRASRRMSRVSHSRCSIEFVYGPPPGVRITCESQLEYHVVLCAAYRQDVVGIEEQLPPVAYHDGRRVKHHYLDLRVTLKNRRRHGLTVKHTGSRDYLEFKAVLPKIRAALVPSVIDELYLVTEEHICPVELHNAKLFHATRRPEPVGDAALALQIANMPHPMSIAELLRLVGMPGQMPAVARAIRLGALELCAKEKISVQTLVQRRGEGA